jgi:hypothetical protein
MKYFCPSFSRHNHYIWLYLARRSQFGKADRESPGSGCAEKREKDSAVDLVLDLVQTTMW